MQFTQSEYIEQKISKVEILSEHVDNRVFEECTFSECNFIECKFNACSFLNCKFIDSVLSAIIPMNCRFVENSFTNSKTIGIDWTKAAQVQGLSFNKCVLDYSNFRMLKIPYIKIINSQAHEVDFSQCDLSQGDFDGTDFQSTIFSQTNLYQSKFIDATNYYIDTKTCNIQGSHFSFAQALSLLSSLDIVLE